MKFLVIMLFPALAFGQVFLPAVKPGIGQGPPAGITLLDSATGYTSWSNTVNISVTITATATYAIYAATGHIGGSQADADSVKIGSTKMVKLDAAGGGFSFFVLKNPPTGAQSVVGYFDATEQIGAIIVTYSGVDTVGMFVGVNPGWGASPGTSGIPSAVGDLIVGAVASDAIGRATEGANQTTIEYEDGAGTTIIQVSSKPASATSTSLAWTTSNSWWNCGGVALKP